MLLKVDFEPITDTSYSLEEVSIVLEFASEVFDVDIDCSVLNVQVVSPDGIEEFIPLECPTCGLHKTFEQPEFNGSQVEVDIFEMRRFLNFVDGEAA